MSENYIHEVMARAAGHLLLAAAVACWALATAHSSRGPHAGGCIVSAKVRQITAPREDTLARR